MLVLLVFIILLAFISSLNVYAFSFNMKTYEKNMQELSDFNFLYSQEKLNQTDALFEYDSRLPGLLEEEITEYEGSEIYGNFFSEFMEWYAPFNSLRIDDPENENKKTLGFEIFLFNPSFYETARFNSFFDIIEGTYPTTENELLMDIYYLKYFNVSIGQEWNFTLRQIKTQGYVYQFNDFSLKNEYVQSTPIAETSKYFYFNVTFKVVGAYLSKNSEFSICQRNFRANYQFLEDGTSIQFDPTVPVMMPIFLNMDFTNCSLDNLHPFQQKIIDIELNWDSIDLTHIITAQYGLLVFYNRDSIRYLKYSQIAVTIEEEFYPFRVLSQNRYIPHNFLTAALNQINEFSRPVWNLTLFLIIPLVLIAIVLNWLTYKHLLYSRKQEFHRLKSQGASNRMIIHQLAVENLILGAISLLFGLLLGYLVYPLFVKTFNNVLIDSPQISQDPSLTINSLTYPFSFTLFIFLANLIASIRLVSQLKTHLLVKEIGKENLESFYDEKSLYAKRNDKKKTWRDSNFLARIQHFLLLAKLKIKLKVKISEKKHLRQIYSDIQFINLPQSQKKRAQQSLEQYYIKKIIDNPVKEEERKRYNHYGWIFLVLGLFPVYIYGIWYFGFEISENIISKNISALIYTKHSNIDLIFMISPAILCLGVIRIGIYENPRFFAKMTSWISTPFIKEYNFLAGIELLKQKQLRQLILVSTVFFSMFTFFNIYNSTVIRNENMYANFSIGGDLSVKMIPGSCDFTQDSIIQKIEENILNYKSMGSNVFSNIVTFYEEENYKDAYLAGTSVYYCNLSNYLQVISSDKRVLPSHDFITQIFSLLPSSDSDIVQIAVNKLFLEQSDFNVGDTFELTASFKSTTNSSIIMKIIPAKIAYMFEILPGTEDFNSNQKKVLLDLGYLNIPPHYKLSNDIFHIIDLNPKFQIPNIEKDLITTFFNNATSEFARYRKIEFAQMGWNDTLYSDHNNSSAFYYLIFYTFIIAGIIIFLSTSVISADIQKENALFYGNLLARGTGKKKNPHFHPI